MKSLLARIVLAAICLTGFGPVAMAAENSGVYQMARLTLPKADRVVVNKSERTLYLMSNNRVMRSYRVALGRYASGQKTREGDARTPEGSYTLDFKLMDSNFYRAIKISYPNERDVARAQAMGVSPGGQIMIHGLPNKMRADEVGHPTLDWTQGCIAVTNREIDEIWRLVELGTPIEIHP
jgi:murein L,D-transpeptidase YafK